MILSALHGPSFFKQYSYNPLSLFSPAYFGYPGDVIWVQYSLCLVGGVQWRVRNSYRKTIRSYINHDRNGLFCYCYPYVTPKQGQR